MLRKMIAVQNNCTIVFGENTFYSNSLSTEEIQKLSKIIENPNSTLEDIKPYFIDKEQIEEITKNNKIVSKIAGYEGIYFFQRGNSWYRNGLNCSLPVELIDAYVEALDNSNQVKVDALDNFWLQLCANPNAQARHDLFRFINIYGFNLTNAGNLILFRNVRNRNEGKLELHNFIVENWFKIKRQKKSPKNYLVDEEKLELVSTKSKSFDKNKYSALETLQWWYENIEMTETEFTDNHSGTMSIKIGKVISMNRKDCDESRASCSKGLLSSPLM